MFKQNYELYQLVNFNAINVHYKSSKKYENNLFDLFDGGLTIIIYYYYIIKLCDV